MRDDFGDPARTSIDASTLEITSTAEEQIQRLSTEEQERIIGALVSAIHAERIDGPDGADLYAAGVGCHRLLLGRAGDDAHVLLEVTAENADDAEPLPSYFTPEWLQDQTNRKPLLDTSIGAMIGENSAIEATELESPPEADEPTSAEEMAQAFRQAADLLLAYASSARSETAHVLAENERLRQERADSVSSLAQVRETVAGLQQAVDDQRREQPTDKESSTALDELIERIDELDHGRALVAERMDAMENRDVTTASAPKASEDDERRDRLLGELVQRQENLSEKIEALRDEMLKSLRRMGEDVENVVKMLLEKLRDKHKKQEKVNHQIEVRLRALEQHVFISPAPKRGFLSWLGRIFGNNQSA